MPVPILLTRLTGGLGAKVLEDLLHKHLVPPSDIIATSRSASKAAQYESQGLQFRVADFDGPIDKLTEAFHNVDTLLFVSSSGGDRVKQHGAVAEAAKAAKVGRVWYVSLAFGGFKDESKVGFMAAHLLTEKLLRE